jgi:adenine-specific DNA-methyltransferase
MAPTSILLYKEVGHSQEGSQEVTKLLESGSFDGPKPLRLLLRLLTLANTQPNDIILDFFSGSSTTAHAVMQLNAEDGGNRKFIMVQLPEPCEENSEAFKAGYKNIAEIGKERIRRAGKKIVEELKDKNQQLELGEDPLDLNKLDIGFRVYKTDSSNMKDVFYHPSVLDQEMLSSLESNIKEDRTPEDLLIQVILDLGLELTLPIETNQIFGNTVYFVQTNALVACFDENVDFDIVDHIADHKPLRVVFRDASFVDDKDRINVEERFKRLSPETKVTVI